MLNIVDRSSCSSCAFPDDVCIKAWAQMRLCRRSSDVVEIRSNQGGIRSECDVEGAVGGNGDWGRRKMFNLLKWYNPEVVAGLYNEVLNPFKPRVKCAICSEVRSRSGCRARLHVIDRQQLPTVSVEEVISYFRLFLLVLVFFTVFNVVKNQTWKGPRG